MVTATKQIRVFHFENNKVIRKMMQKIIGNEDHVMLLGGMEYSKFHVGLLIYENIDVLLIGLNIPGRDHYTGNDEYTLCNTVRKDFPDVKIIIHSVYTDAESIKKIMSAGAHGFVSKLVKNWEIIEAIQSVSKGAKYICSQTSQTLKNSHDYFIGYSDCPLKNDRIFSNREMDVLRLLGIGLSSREIADNLYISLKTVETHRKSLIKKSFVRNTAQLIAFSSLQGYL